MCSFIRQSRNTNYNEYTSFPNTFWAPINRIERMSVEAVYLAIVSQIYHSGPMSSSCVNPRDHSCQHRSIRKHSPKNQYDLYIRYLRIWYDTCGTTRCKIRKPRMQWRINFARPIFKLFKNHWRCFLVPRCRAAATNMTRKWHESKAMLMRHPRTCFYCKNASKRMANVVL